MKPGSLLMCSQELASGPNSKPDASSPHIPTLFPKVQSNIFAHLCLGHASDLFPSDYLINILYAPHLSHVCYMPFQSHILWLHHPNNIW